MAEHLVAAVDDIPADRGLVVEVEGREIGIFRVGDEFHALRNVCPHQGGPVGTGGIFPTVCARVEFGKRVVEYHDEEKLVVACPWHGWEFDVRTGVCTADPERMVARYETVVRDGRVGVVLPDRSPA